MSKKTGLGGLASSIGLDQVGIGPLNVGNMLDTMEFVKKAWSSFSLPPSFTPTVDLEELDKRIADLKAVEHWLNMNLNMLHGTIQALEIQRGTIATLRAFGRAVAPGASPEAAAAAISPEALAAAMAAMQPQPAPFGPMAAAMQPVAPGVEAAAGAGTAAAPPRAGASRKTAGAKKGGKAAGAPSPLDPGLSASAWWNLLQTQFNNVAAAALSGMGLPGAAGPVAAQAAPAPAAQPAPSARKGTRSASHAKAPSAARKRAS